MNVLRVIAKAGNYKVVLDANSVISLYDGRGLYICDAPSAYEAIRQVVKDPDTRKELLRQWAQSMNGGTR